MDQNGCSFLPEDAERKGTGEASYFITNNVEPVSNGAFHLFLEKTQ